MTPSHVLYLNCLNLFNIPAGSHSKGGTTNYKSDFNLPNRLKKPADKTPTKNICGTYSICGGIN